MGNDERRRMGAGPPVGTRTALVLAAQSVSCTADQAGRLRLPRPVVREGSAALETIPRALSRPKQGPDERTRRRSNGRVARRGRLALKCFTPDH